LTKLHKMVPTTGIELVTY